MKITEGITPTEVLHQVLQVTSSAKFKLDEVDPLTALQNFDGIDLICLPVMIKLLRQTKHFSSKSQQGTQDLLQSP